MMKNWRRRLAAWIAPEMAREAEGVEEMRRRVGVSHMLIEAEEARFTSAALSISKHKNDADALRKSLCIAKLYVQDAVDELHDQLLELSPKSKKRPALIATLEAARADLRVIEAAINNTKPDVSQPAEVSA